jgi:hypothetical protein
LSEISETIPTACFCEFPGLACVPPLKNSVVGRENPVRKSSTSFTALFCRVVYRQMLYGGCGGQTSVWPGLLSGFLTGFSPRFTAATPFVA